MTKLIASFFYIGFFPLAPGSLASAVGVLICVLLHQTLFFYIAVFVLVTALGFMTSGKMEKLMQKEDPSCIVIDEVSGIMISLFLLPITPAVVITTFFLFRAFDMFKIYPVNKFEEIKGGTGVMMDDIVAGIYTNIVMHAAIRLSGIVPW